MRHTFARLFFVLAAAAFVPAIGSSSSVAQSEAEKAPADLAKWQLTCECNGEPPNAMILKDNNGEILYAARNGVTVAQLKSHGISASGSQLKLLQDWRILTRQGDRYTTAIPTLDEHDQAALRKSLRPRVAQTEAQVGGDIANIVATLQRNGYAGHAYAVVFSYVLDGLMWQNLKSKGALPPEDLNSNAAHWSGAFWAVYPPRRNAVGSNSTDTPGAWIVYTWNDRVLAALQALDVKQFALRVPTITNAPGDAIYRSGSRVTEILADAVQLSERSAPVPNLRISGDKAATTIVGGEFISELMGDLVAHHAVDVPDVLSGKADPTPASLRDLVFVIRKP